ncbi:MAG TPA: hypothetical protein VFO86_08570 [Terriglobia bacterium]|nr:hypothetical protein [Terriglobia bacterium]
MLSRKEIDRLLSRLSSKKGYCEVPSNVFDGVPFTIDDYTKAILEAEGMEYSVGGPFWTDVEVDVREAFRLNDEQSIELADGSFD